MCPRFDQIQCLKPDQCTMCTPTHDVLTSHTISTVNANQTDRMRAVMYIINSDARADFTYGLTTAPHLYSVQYNPGLRGLFLRRLLRCRFEFSPGHGSDWATTFAVATAIRCPA